MWGMPPRIPNKKAGIALERSFAGRDEISTLFHNAYIFVKCHRKVENEVFTFFQVYTNFNLQLC